MNAPSKPAPDAAYSAREAEVIAADFAAALLNGNPQQAAGYFAPTGRFLTPDGTEVRGHGPIARVLFQLTVAEHELAIRNGRTVVAGEVALNTQYWTRKSGAASAEAFESATIARLVLQRSDRWQILIASPWG